MLQRTCRSKIRLIFERGTVSAYSLMESMVSLLRSVCTPCCPSPPEKTEVPFFRMETMLVWAYRTSTETLSSPWKSSTMKCRGISESRNSTVQRRSARNWAVRCRAGPVTASSTSIRRSASPPNTPRQTAASMPVMPPELGIWTQRTFLIMLPLHRARIRAGSAPSTSRARAAA